MVKFKEAPKPGLEAGTFQITGEGCITFVLTKSGHLVIHAYDKENPGEHDEPVGAFDSSLPRAARNNWTVE